jgi:hypothetical protein
MSRTIHLRTPDWQDVPEGVALIWRKVARSGHISYAGHPYFVSNMLARHTLCILVWPDRLVVDATISIQKEFHLDG